MPAVSWRPPHTRACSHTCPFWQLANSRLTDLAVDACAGLISYLGLMTQPETFGQWDLEWIDPAHFMRLDADAPNY